MRPAARRDHILDLLFYVPLAPLGSLVGWSLPTCVLVGGMLSLIAEAVQLFSPDRSPEGNDVIGNVAGTGVGVIAVLLYRRRKRITER